MICPISVWAVLSLVTTPLAAGARRQRKGRADRRTTELASTVRNALEETILVDLFPRAQIDVAIQVLQADGSVLAACINTAMLAVADAGAPPFTPWHSIRESHPLCTALSPDRMIWPSKSRWQRAPKLRKCSHAGYSRCWQKPTSLWHGRQSLKESKSHLAVLCA